MTKAEVMIIHEADPLIVAQDQRELIDRMDPGFWGANYIRLNIVLSNSGLELRKFGDFTVHEGQGDTPRKHLGEKFEDEGIQFLSAEDILPSGVDLHNYKFISEKQHQRLARTSLQVEDILFGRIGVASTGRVGIMTRLSRPCNINNSLDVFRVKSISPFYVVCFLKSKYGQMQIDRLKRGVASTAITLEQIKSVTIPMAPEPLQATVEREYKTTVACHHDRAMDAKAKMIQAQENADITAAKKYQVGYKRNLGIAEAMLNDLIRQVEEIIEGERTEIEPVDRVLEESQD